MPLGQRVAAILPLLLSLICCAELTRGGVPRRRALVSGALLVVSLLVWMQVEKVYEGPTVIRVSPHHGLTIADLDVVPGGAIAAVIGWRWITRRARP
jgi:hypothetical protein